MKPLRRLPRVVLTLLLLAGLTGCASSYTRPAEGTTQRGMASWYGEPFHGRLTANGETYDMHGFTAAHRELPLGTWVEVTHLDNGRKLKVRVNDRGPFIRGRILDLSYGAAKKLDMVNEGVAKIELRVLEVGDGRRGDDRFTRFAVQLGAFGSKANADAMKQRFSKQFSKIDVRQGDDGVYRVWIVGFSDRAGAEEARRGLAASGQETVVVPIP